jgi:hypothetical protein
MILNNINEKEINCFYEGKVFGLQSENQLSQKELELKNPYKPNTEEFKFWINGYYESFK